MAITRRGVLIGLGAGGLIFGLHRLYGHASAGASQPEGGGGTGPARRDPDEMRRALAEMKRRGAPGLVIVLPESSEARESLRVTLKRLLEFAALDVPWNREAERVSWLVEGVPIVAEASAAGALAGETLVLLEPDGTRALGSSAALTEATLPAEARRLLRTGGRLQRRAAAASSDRVRELLEDLSSGDAESSAAAFDRLLERFDEAGPAILEAHERAGTQATAALLVAAVARRADPDPESETRPLPYGVRWLEGAGPDPCPTCGMMTSPRGRDLLRFLGEPDP